MYTTVTGGHPGGRRTGGHPGGRYGANGHTYGGIPDVGAGKTYQQALRPALNLW